MSDDENVWIKDDYGQDEFGQPDNLSDDQSSNKSFDSLRDIKNEESQGEDRKDREQSEVSDNQSQMSDIEKRDNCKIVEPSEPWICNPVKITCQYMTKYQYALIIGKRAHQISKNSPLYVELDDKEVKKYDIIQIAEMELRARKLPYILRRVLPNGYYEDWKVNDLLLSNI